jgi:SAM-dependent methyltransferase
LGVPANPVRAGELSRYAAQLKRVSEHMSNLSSHQNPWLTIPASDYESHMSSTEVGQLSVLNHTLADVLASFSPRSVAVLGCSTGNGFEHIDPNVTHRVVGIDLNPDYLDILARRHKHSLPGLELVCADLASCRFGAHSFDLIHGALIFEYVNPKSLLPELARWLRPDGVLSVVLQLPSPVSKMVSKTPYASLRSLESIMRLVEPSLFRDLAWRCGLAMFQSREVNLKLGKRFHVAYYRKRRE